MARWIRRPRSSLLVGTVALTLSRGVLGVTLLLGALIVARFEGVVALGQFGLAVTLGTFAAVLADAGLVQCLIPKLARTERAGWSAVWLQLQGFYLRSAPVVAVAYLALAWALWDGDTRTAVLAALPWWLLSRTSYGYRAFLTVAERLELDAKASVVETVVSLGLLVLAVAFSDSAALAVLSLAGGAGIGVLVRRGAVRALLVAPMPAIRPSSRALLKETWLYGAFAGLAVAYMRVDVILLSLLASTLAVGVYQAPVRLVTAMLLVPDAMALIFLAQRARRGDDAAWRRRQRALLVPGVAAGVALVGVTAVLGDDLLGLLYGPELEAAGFAFTVLVAAVPVRLMTYLNGNELIASGRLHARLGCLGITTAFAVLAGAPAIAAWEYDGAAVVTLAAEVLLCCCYAWTVWRSQGLSAVLYPRASTRWGATPAPPRSRTG